MALTHSLLAPGELAQKVGANAREARLAQNLSRKSLAKMAGISESTIKRFESNGQITLDALILIATALSATRQIAELFKHEQPVSLEEIKQTGRTRGRR
ncbi:MULTISPECIES: helix-turn-helix domain-containing protein [Pseudomonadaceae]|uniref:helix-turn-helix domain-containing protein n=1 Tax=Pseudomonadaceae TaxID=135621 RepID=UPI0008FB9243|nr:MULTISPECIES: helix-turn-helix transcriptional regulator [Pseudomonadaceae]MAE23942.1 XRE family transcriptional regulator [Pseudomonas sp.]ELL4388342.1 helix-turn-helix transcriptional regulator [Pseudomonas aeruginosa]KSR29497.2 transcriptional regulator [Pseudomonas aeruginosa]MBH8759135.1 helix-turn-helix transcriptional regulator [Pseudomonas aeruginosa]MBI8324457.1 helix-turn-helix transcriptional regulator [Pseudomonas aeruginosa]